MNQLDALVNQYESAVLEYWHWLHAHPELSGEEKESSAYIASALRKMGLAPIERLGGYGVVALIEGVKPGKCVGLRADFDALPINELTGLPFTSLYPGKMHACGHDAHAAMLLGVAHVLNDIRDQFNGTVKLIFQPSEENPETSGGRGMLADGVLENPTVDAVFAQHVNVNLPVGKIALRSGAMFAASDRFYITVHGKGCHGARPDQGVDAIAVSAQVISALQNIISRTVSPYANSVITIGKISGGIRASGIPETVEMEGTCRNLDCALRDSIVTRMEQIIKGITEGMGATYSFNYVKGYPPMINDPAMVDLVSGTAEKLLGKENVKILERADLGGEDFAFFTQKVPGAYYSLGSHEDGTPFWPGHTSQFALAADSLRVGVRLMTETALNYLNSGI